MIGLIEVIQFNEWFMIHKCIIWNWTMRAQILFVAFLLFFFFGLVGWCCAQSFQFEAENHNTIILRKKKCVWNKLRRVEREKKLLEQLKYNLNAVLLEISVAIFFLYIYISFTKSLANVRLRLLLLKIYNYYLIINNVLYISVLNAVYNMIGFELFEQRLFGGQFKSNVANLVEAF